MRDLKECQAEVFRRSEKRIKARKRRRLHILVACLPVALCLSLFAAVGLPGGTPDGLSGTSVGNENSHDGFGSLSCSIYQITVVGADFSRTYTDTADISRISDQLYAFETRGWGEANNETADEGKGPEDTYDRYSSIADSATAGYTVTLVMHEGGETQYRLAGNRLENLITGNGYTLTPNQADQLYELLGIPHR